VERLWRYRIPLTSVLLSIFSVFLVSISARAPQHRDPVARLLLDGLAPLQAGVTWLTATLRLTWDGYVNLVQIRADAERLRARLSAIEQQLVRLEELEQANRRLEALMQFRAAFEGPALGARVIGRAPLPWSDTLTIDRGQRDGVRRGMAVISPQGVVGQIAEASQTAARVLLLTDHNSGIDALVQRSRARGIVQGASQDGCHMKYIPRGDDVAVGDRVVTSGLDGVFPKGLVIGEVSEVSRRHRGLLQVAVVRPSAALDRVEEVLVVDATTRGPDEVP
jgi:rod shape-determining protein MreC